MQAKQRAHQQVERTGEHAAGERLGPGDHRAWDPAGADDRAGIADATGQGFLAVTPGDAPTYKASTINFAPSTPSLATGALVKLDAGRNVKVFIGGGGSANFLIDITGYYL